MEIPFCGPAYNQKSRSLNGQRCINYYPVLDQNNAKYPIALYPTPGCSLLATNSSTEVRGSFSWEQFGYFVAGNKFYSVGAINSTGTNGVSSVTPIELGTLESYNGRVMMRCSGDQIFIAVLGTLEAYVYNLTDPSVFSFAKIEGPYLTGDYPGADWIEFQDGYFITCYNGAMYVSAAFDAMSWDPLDVAIPTYQGDKLRTIITVKENLILLKDLTVEIWFNSGATFPFERRQNSSLRYGISAPQSAQYVDESIIFLTKSENGENLVARLSALNYGNVELLSNETITYQISTYPRIDDAYSYNILWQGHVWYCLTFPTGNTTWVYDLTTKMWFEWKSLATSTSQTSGQYFANNYMNVNGTHVIGDSRSGNLYQLIDYKLTDYPDTVPVMVLEVSKDGGNTWGKEMQRVAGKVGQYMYRTMWKVLGQARDWMFRLTYTDNVSTDNGVPIIRVRETTHTHVGDSYITISDLRLDIAIDPAPPIILGCNANGSVSGFPQQGSPQ